MNLASLSMTRMAQMIAAREVSAEELMWAHLTLLERHNPRLNAVIEVDAQAALEAAREADRRRPHDDEPFFGVPMTVKGAWNWSGHRNTAGTLGRKDTIATEDATVIARMRAAGAIPFAITNVPELSLALETDNLLFGRSNNPYDLTRTPGGSGGGGAAAIAAGYSPFEVGGDMAGSIRIPAHFCGIAGLKPTHGRVPLTGYVPGPYGVAMLFATAGPMARSIEDLTATLHLLAGPDGHDAYAVPARLRHPGGYRIGSGRIAFHSDNGILAPTRETAMLLARVARSLPAIEEATPPGLEEAFELQWNLLGADGGYGIETLSRLQGTEENHYLFHGFLDTLRPGKTTAGGVLDLLAKRDLFRSRMAGFLETYDAILSPACAFPALPHGYSTARMAAFSYASAHNLSGCPAVVVRCGETPEGLPIGVQVTAPHWREDIALAIAARLEEEFGGYKPPSLQPARVR